MLLVFLQVFSIVGQKYTVIFACKSARNANISNSASSMIQLQQHIY